MTVTPPRADLRTLAVEAIRHGDHALADDGECGRREDQLAVVDAVLAAVLPEHRRMVLEEAADRLDPGPRDHGRIEDEMTSGDWVKAAQRGAAANLRMWAWAPAAAAPPAGPSAPVPAEDAPAVPEEAAPDLREMAGRWFKLADDAEWLTTWLTAHGLSATAGPGQVVRAVARDLQAWAVTGQPAGEGVDYGPCPHTEALGRLHLEWLAEVADLKTERDDLRQHILDIDAHATPNGDIPDEPGWTGTYLVTAGALHRALGKIGHSAPKCEAEAERDRLAREVTFLVESRERWTRATLDKSYEVARLTRDLTQASADRDRLARELHEAQTELALVKSRPLFSTPEDANERNGHG